MINISQSSQSFFHYLSRKNLGMFLLTRTTATTTTTTSTTTTTTASETTTTTSATTATTPTVYEKVMTTKPFDPCLWGMFCSQSLLKKDENNLRSEWK